LFAVDEAGRFRVPRRTAVDCLAGEGEFLGRNVSKQGSGLKVFFARKKEKKKLSRCFFVAWPSICLASLFCRGDAEDEIHRIARYPKSIALKSCCQLFYFYAALKIKGLCFGKRLEWPRDGRYRI
jgi:hypothetical protein